MTIIDDPPSNISDYVEDVLPLHPTVGDMDAALTKRGFSATTIAGMRLTHWVRPVRDGKSGHLRIYSQSGTCMLDYWPNAQPRIHRRGDIRAMLREADRMIHAFEPPGWEKF